MGLWSLGSLKKQRLRPYLTQGMGGVMNMLKEKADLSFISKVTGLSEEEIKKLKEVVASSWLVSGDTVPTEGLSSLLAKEKKT